MTEPTELNDIAAQELPAAAAAITGGDERVAQLARDFDRLIRGVDSASRNAISKARQLHDDDVMNAQGKARLLSELPHDLVRATTTYLEQADINLDIIEGLHLAAILRHDGRDDANLREELNNYVANLKQQNAVATMVQLAANPRYATYMAGPMGTSLAARFGFDAAILQKTALEALAVNGTEDQVRRSKALAAIPAARRVLGLARGGRDNVAQETQRPPAPKPSQALMS